MKKKCKLVISGYYGFNNAGDEAVLAGIIAGLRLVAPSLVPIVLTSNPAGTSVLHNVAVAHREQPGMVWQTLRQGNALLSGGGSLLQDVTSKRSVYYYLGVMAMARLAGRPYCIYGQGIGPLQASMARKFTTLMLRSSRGIWVRDQESAGLVLDLLGTAIQQKTSEMLPRVDVAGDAAFLLPAPEKEPARCMLRQLADAAGCPDTAPIWLTAIRPWDTVSGWELPMLDGLLNAAVTAGAGLGFISMQPDTDHSMAERLNREIAGRVPSFVVAPGDVHKVRELLAGADLVVAMRLHALILAAAAGVPGVALSYDPKVSALAAELPLPVLTVNELAAAGAADRFSALIGHAWHSRVTAGEQLRAATEVRRQAALDALAAAIDALGMPTGVSSVQG